MSYNLHYSRKPSSTTLYLCRKSFSPEREKPGYTYKQFPGSRQPHIQRSIGIYGNSTLSATFYSSSEELPGLDVDDSLFP